MERCHKDRISLIAALLLLSIFGINLHVRCSANSGFESEVHKYAKGSNTLNFSSSVSIRISAIISGMGSKEMSIIWHFVTFQVSSVKAGPVVANNLLSESVSRFTQTVTHVTS